MGLRAKRGSNRSLGSTVMMDVVIWAEVIDQGERSRSESELCFRERERASGEEWSCTTWIDGGRRALGGVAIAVGKVSKGARGEQKQNWRPFFLVV